MQTIARNSLPPTNAAGSAESRRSQLTAKFVFGQTGRAVAKRAVALLLGAVVGLSLNLEAAQPILPLSAKLTDTSGRVIDGPQDITFRLYTDAAGGTPVWAEAHPSTPVIRGVVSVNLGEINDLGDVDGDEFWIGVTIGGDSEMTPRLKLPGYAAGTIGGGSFGGLPIGSVVAFASTSPPRGWLACDGTLASKVEFKRLFEVIGDSFGPTEGDRFRLPDLGGRSVIGSGMGSVKDISGNHLTHRRLGEYGGEETHLLTIAEMPRHNHTLQVNDTTGTGPQRGPPETVNPRSTVGYPSDFTGGGLPHNTMPPYLALRYFIKAK